MVEARSVARSVHGHELVDEYGWLRADNWRDVLRDPATLPDAIRSVLEGENAYADAHLRPLAALRTELLAEMRGRIREDDASVPLADGPWLYYQRYREGGQQPLYCRKPIAPDGSEGTEQVLLDGDAERQGHAFFSIGDVAHSPDHRLLAWSADAKGSELYLVKVRDCATGLDRAGTLTDTDGTVVWARSCDALYSVKVDENHRTCAVVRHRLGGEDTIVYAEPDPAWFVGLGRTTSGAFGVVTVSDHAASECHLLDLADADAAPRCVEPRSPDHRYSLVHHPDHDRGTLFIRTNCDGAEDFKIVATPVGAPGRETWRDVVPHRLGRMITGLAIHPGQLVRVEREEGLPRIVVRALVGGDEHAITFDEEAYSVGLEARLAFATDVLRFTYASPTTPRETTDYDLRTRARVLRKRQAIPSGHDPRDYVTRRLLAAAPDGARVPVTLLHRAGQPLDGTAPLLLYGYGAYGHAMPAGFSANALSLVDRGFVYAIAHVRGGSDKGWSWYLDGKLAAKPNTFSDFIAVAERLAADGFTARGRVVAQGGSAGGMLMGAVANMAPSLFAGIVAAVPFVDVLNTMLDAELPLTPPEWLEWGNPIEDAEAFAAIAAYSPYDRVSAQDYPPILALAGLTDPRVTYWEPAKWVARLRARMTGGGPVLLKTHMGAGHGGASGRFDRLGEIADQYAFAIACVGGA